VNQDPPKRWAVWLGEFKLGEIKYDPQDLTESNSYHISAPGHAVPETQNNKYETLAGAFNYFRMSLPALARVYLKLLPIQ
jgi:hypothetical protein